MKRAAMLLAVLALSACAATGAPVDRSAFVEDVLAVEGVDRWIVENVEPANVPGWGDHLADAASNVVCSDTEPSEAEVGDVFALAYPGLTDVPGFTPTLIDSARANLCA